MMSKRQPMSAADVAAIESKIAYHQEMEYFANEAGDFTKAGHHIKMQEIYEALKEKLEQENDDGSH